MKHNNVEPSSKTILQVKRWKHKKLKVVFTNGCFDLLHVGHITYLEKAREYGDALIVGINTDATIKRLKGKQRPIFSLKERMEILMSLRMIDAVIPFDEDTPLKLIREIKPDVLVKGGDWSLDNIVGKDDVLLYGGSVFTIPLVSGKSTTNLVNKARRAGGLS